MPADAEMVARILGQAFERDPLLNWVLPNPANYPEYFATMARYLYLKHDMVYMAEDGSGAAMCLPPNVTHEALSRRQVFTLLRKMRSAGGVRGLVRYLKLSRIFQEQYPPQPYVYLHAIGVRKDRQGCGVGSSLLQVVLSQCDREVLCAYLENANDRNLPLYERHGFRCIHKIALSVDGPRIRFMLRRPHAG